jgi:hypothetical protein
MPNKPKQTQKQNINEVSGRDCFSTPNYAADLLIPFIPKHIDNIWECAMGEGKIAERLSSKNYNVYCSDIRPSEKYWDSKHNFLIDQPLEITRWISYEESFCIITNPPFSLKYKFIQKAVEYGVPFAFLIPFDMCQKMAILFDKYNCQGVVPKSRINYITPTGKSEATGHSSYYHSFWITRFFELNNQLVFIDLTKEMRKDI